jgi:hypothetical protein
MTAQPSITMLVYLLNVASSSVADPASPAQARISPERCRLAAVRPARRPWASGPAGMLEVGPELLAERGGVLGVQVDLIAGALEGEPDRLLGRAAGQVVFQGDGYFLGDLTLPPYCDGGCTVSGQCPQPAATPPITQRNTGKTHGLAEVSSESPALPTPTQSITLCHRSP